MKIKLILKENNTQFSGLKENPYNLEVIKKLIDNNLASFDVLSENRKKHKK